MRYIQVVGWHVLRNVLYSLHEQSTQVVRCGLEDKGETRKDMFPGCAEADHDTRILCPTWLRG